MHLLTLSALHEIVSSNSITNTSPLVPAYIQEQLQLAVKQMLMGLPVEPLLDNNLQIQQWVNQLKQLSPSLFVPYKKLLSDIPITAKIDLNPSFYRTNTSHKYPQKPQFKVIEVRANVGIVRGNPRLFEWAIRHPILSWQDRVKLWVAAEYFKIQPQELQLIVLALHPTRAAQKVSFSWDRRQHRQIKNWLLNAIKLETEQTFVNSEHFLAGQAEEIATAINLDEIDEVSL
jgi:hypothetical protein